MWKHLSHVPHIAVWPRQGQHRVGFKRRISPQDRHPLWGTHQKVDAESIFPHPWTQVDVTARDRVSLGLGRSLPLPTRAEETIYLDRLLHLVRLKGVNQRGVPAVPEKVVITTPHSGAPQDYAGQEIPRPT